MRNSTSWVWLVVASLAWWSTVAGAQDAASDGLPPPTEAAPAAVPSQPAVLFASPPAPPAESVAETHTNWALIAPGIGLLGAGYVFNLVVGLLAGVHPCIGPGGCLPPPPTDWSTFRVWSAIPLAGPWAQLAVFPEVLSDNPGWIAWLITTGALQAAGLVLLVVGIATPREVARSSSARALRSSVEVLPSVGPGGAGLSVHGTF
jgi:hypothetical protein